MKTIAVVLEQISELKGFLRTRWSNERDRLDVPLVLTGAGTSEFIGHCLEPALRLGGFDATTRATTDITVWPQVYLPRSADFLLVSFARSGNSPESEAVIELTNKLRPRARHLIITCNREGKLAQYGRVAGDRALLLELPESTNDKGLAMTSSFSSMLVAGQVLTFLDRPEEYHELVSRQLESARSFLTRYADAALELSEREYSRAVFVGCGPLYGLSMEAHLKMQELTAGRVVCKAESTLGLRHGPMVAIDRETLLVFFLSSSPHARRYEEDLLVEVATKNLAGHTLAVCEKASPVVRETVDTVWELDPAGAYRINDLHTVPVAVLGAQLLALGKSLKLGLQPDTPSTGVINRVVHGVRIHPYTAG